MGISHLGPGGDFDDIIGQNLKTDPGTLITSGIFIPTLSCL
jgi:hypothetical protein